MNNTTTILFNCPECRKFFEYDAVGESELVSCPLCGDHFKTVKKGDTLKLEPFEYPNEAVQDLKIPLLIAEAQ